MFHMQFFALPLLLVPRCVGHVQDLPVPDADAHLFIPRRDGPPSPVQQMGSVPPPLTLRLDDTSLMGKFMRNNIAYMLGTSDVDSMLYHFRLRAGVKDPPTGDRMLKWDQKYMGSNAGRFLMGAGNTLRWIEHAELRNRVDAVVQGMFECQNKSNGYLMAYEPAGFMHSEEGDYGRSWVTQGLIEAGKAGNQRAFPMLRSFYDWFNNPDQNPYLPYLYDGVGNAEQGQIASTRMYLETPVGVYADSQVAQDTFRDDYWLQQLIAKDTAGMSNYHMPAPNHPHCYEITAFLSMHDNYRATHNATWLQAAESAWELIVQNFLNVDGTSALAEGRPDNGQDWHPKSYPLRQTAKTGETCCSTFWIKFNQRFQLMAPWEEKYAAEIEKTLYNAVLRQLGFLENVPWENKTYSGFNFRSFVNMQGTIEQLRTPMASCCEGQGTRVFGSIPEYVFTLNASSPTDGFWLNLFVPSEITMNASVVAGEAPNPPPTQPTPPKPPAPLPPAPPAPNLTWREIATNSYYASAQRSGYWPLKGGAANLTECQQRCVKSGHPNNCMGIMWSGPTTPSPPPPVPPSPKLCESGCTMEALGDHFYSDGAFSDPKDLSLDECNALCLKDPMCIQVTYGPGPRRCVTYSAIYSTLTKTSAAVVSFLKCANHAHGSIRPGWIKAQAMAELHDSRDRLCAPHLTPRGVSKGCVLFRNIDMTNPVTARPNVTQWLLQGRRNNVEHDWVPSPPPPIVRVTPNGTVPLKIRIKTSFPFDGKVSLKMSWAFPEVKQVSLNARIRIPSWLSSATVIPAAVNGQIVGSGKPGSYLELDRVWSRGDTINFELPMLSQATLIQYPHTGIDNIKGAEGKRFALKIGPIVLPCVGQTNKDDAVVLPLDAATDPSTWLEPLAGSSLHFTVKGIPAQLATFKPSWSIMPNETFTTYPVFSKSVVAPGAQAFVV